MSRILIVDDDGDMTRITSNWLKKAGYEVSSVETGQQALDTVASEDFDLMILDYAMPEMDGPAVLKALKSDDKTKNIPVIMRTGMNDDVVSEVIEEMHPAGVVSKSDGKKALMAAVGEIIG